MAEYSLKSDILLWQEWNLRTAPEKAGVYVLRKDDKSIGYIGSAGTGRLQARLLEHLRLSSYPRTRYFDWYQTPTEADARQLERDWIVRYDPPWNIIIPGLRTM